MGYTTNSKGYRIYNLKNQIMEISMHVIFDEFNDLVINKEDEEEISRKEGDNIQEHSPHVLPRS